MGDAARAHTFIREMQKGIYIYRVNAGSKSKFLIYNTIKLKMMVMDNKI